MAKLVAINNSRLSELPKDRYGDNRINVPITIAIPGNESEKILLDLDNITEDELRHFIIDLTNIKGEINLNSNVKTAKGHNNSGEVDAR